MKKQRGTAGLKKILTVLLCAALVFGLAACGEKESGRHDEDTDLSGEI